MAKNNVVPLPGNLWYDEVSRTREGCGMAKIKCPNPLCRSANVQLIGGKTKTSLNLNPLHPLTLTKQKPVGKQTFMCNSCGKVFTHKI